LLTYLYIIQIIISTALIAAVLLQTKGSGLGGIFGGQGAVYTSRRGVERTIFNVTIGLVVAFFVFATIIVIVAG
jgi:preprotein translocase subunit SecG